jgi:hypothetical protein
LISIEKVTFHFDFLRQGPSQAVLQLSSASLWQSVIHLWEISWRRKNWKSEEHEVLKGTSAYLEFYRTYLEKRGEEKSGSN